MEKHRSLFIQLFPIAVSIFGVLVLVFYLRSVLVKPSNDKTWVNTSTEKTTSDCIRLEAPSDFLKETCRRSGGLPKLSTNTKTGCAIGYMCDIGKGSSKTLSTYKVPDNWVRYSNSDFIGISYQFYYPSGHIIYDTDPASGDIEVRDAETQHNVVAVNKMTVWGFKEYDGSPQENWFLNSWYEHEKSSGLDLNDISLAPVKFANGNVFYLVSYPQILGPYTILPRIYCAILSGKAIFVQDWGKLSEDELYSLLQTLVVK
ncbi:hypothetical protein L6255_02290 [Candidatus Parcubacteria bacterium]|nr:hypothetical protein [Patescibacteria group bacterium]MCG2689246.1 hypothetical protein [Candidatus Parcubacteria bacterium]